MRSTLILVAGITSSLVAAAGGVVPDPVMAPGTAPSGSAIVTPDTGVAGEFGSWDFVYTVGESGIATGGGIRVEFPDSWHAGPRNSAYRVQASEPSADHYVSGHCSRAGVRIETIVEHEVADALVKNPKPSLDGRYERYVFVVRAIVREGQLQRGDTITVTYGDRSGGSRGYRAGEIVMPPTPVLVAVDDNGDSAFQLLGDGPRVTIAPGPPAEMMVHAPSEGVVREPMELLVALVDKEYNPVQDPVTVQLSVASGDAEMPDTVVVPRGQGFVRFTVTPRASGILRVHASAATAQLTASANPVEVLASSPDMRTYWGELHSHTHYSWDAVGSDAFDYARNISGLDFYVMTDHSMAPDPRGTRGLNKDTWARYSAEVEAHNDPPRFVTLQAYECSFGAPYGHHNVFFRGNPGPLLYPSESTLPELWKALEAGNALTIPHHTGKFPLGLDLTVHDPELRRNFEIYSGHGLSEAYDPDHPLSFEHSTFTSDSVSQRAPTYAQDAWGMGQWLSTVAASDDHRSRPGQPEYGITAIRAARLARDDVFQALYDRYTYGTTGERIILDFTLNGVPMGKRVTVDAPPEMAIRAVGTDRIAWVELLRHSPGDDAFTVIQRWEPDAPEFAAQYTDADGKAGSIYYVRLRQQNDVRGRVVMAWSSPIWTGAAE